MTRFPQPTGTLDFASKGLIDVQFDDLLGEGENKESRICGSATLVRKSEAWPLLPHVGPDGAERHVSTPCRVRFRIATTLNGDAMDTFYRNLQLYKALVAHQYRYYEPFIAFWHAPNEGNWAISMDATPESLAGFWRREVRPGIDRCEAAVHARAEKRARERQAEGVPVRPTLAPRRSSETISPAPGNAEAVARANRLDVPTVQVEAAMDGLVLDAAKEAPRTAATVLASPSLNKAVQDQMHGGDQGGHDGQTGPPLQSPVELLRQEMFPAQGGPTRGAEREASLDGGQNGAPSSPSSNLSAGSPERESDMAAIPRDDLRLGYGRALKVLMQIAEAMWDLHRRRVCLVVLRPEAFTVSPTPSTPGTWPDTEPLPFTVHMSRTATAIILDGFDEGRVVSKVPSSPKTAQASLRQTDGANLTSQHRSESHSLLDMADAIGHKSLGLDNTLDALYDEATLRFHARYIAPEALAGKNSVGPLIDVYSFGVLAHELLSGKRWHEVTHPSIDLLAVLNMHQTNPIGDLEATLDSAPKELCQIIRKCLRVDVDGRYASMQSLLCDLHSLEDRIQGRVHTPFTVGQVDAISRFDQRGAGVLVDRELQLAQLDQVYSAIKEKGIVRAVCVWGTSGSGKSHLVETWARNKEALAGHCIVGMAKLDQHLVKPLSGLVQVFESLLAAVFSDPQEDHARWRAKINDVLQSQSNVFLSLISPNWRAVLVGDEEGVGEPAAITEGSVDWGQYVASFRTWAWSLLRLFGSAQRPLVIVLDDIQWQEPAEADLWKALLQHPSRHLLHTIILATYRSDTPPEGLFGDEVLLLETQPLDLQATTSVVRKALHIEGELDAQMSFLAAFLLATTKGNAFFTVNLLSALARDAVLSYDYVDRRWTVTTAALPLYSEAGIDAFAEGVLRELPSSSRSVLKTLACLPSRGVPISLVASIMAWPQTATASAFQQASHTGCVTVGKDEVCFTHDRMHAAALGMIKDEEALQLYLSVGHALEFAGPAYVFTAVDSLLVARKLGDRSVPHDDLCRLIVVAIRRAARSASFDLARTYLKIARDVLVQTYGEDHLWSEPPQRDMAFQLVPLYAEVGGALGNLDEALEKVQEALNHAEDVIKRLEFLTLKVRLEGMRHNGPQALQHMLEACDLAQFDVSESGTAARAALLPKSAIELQQAAERSLGRPRCEARQEAVHSLLLNLVAYAGPVLYSSLGIAGTRPFFEVGLYIALHDSAAIRQAAAGYVFAYFAVLASRDLHTAYGQAVLSFARTIPMDGSIFQLSHMTCELGAMHVVARSLKDVSFTEACVRAMSVDQVDIVGYVLALEAQNNLLAGADASLFVRDVAMESLSIPGIIRSAITSFINLSAIVTGRRAQEDGLGLSDQEWAILEYAPMFALMAHLNQAWLDIFFVRDASKSVSNVERLAGGGEGLLPGIEAQFVQVLYPLLRGSELSQLELDKLDHYRRTCHAFSHLQDLQFRLNLLDALTSSEPWPIKVDKLESAIEYAEANGNLLWAGFIAQTAAELVLQQSKSRRLAYGLGCAAQRLYGAAKAQALVDLAYKRYPSKYSAAAKLSPQSIPDPVDKLRHVSTPTTEASSTSDDQPHLSKAATLEAKLNLDSILKTCLVLASERDKHSLLQSLLVILLQLQRADYACLSIQDPSNKDLALDLVAAGSIGSVRTWDGLKLSEAAAFCPSTVLLGVATTKQTRRLNDPGGAAVFKRDPFFARSALPKSAVCYPLRVQGKFVGVVYVSGRSPISPSSETQVTVLATFAAIALEAHYSRSTLESIIQARTLQLTQALAHRSSFLTSVSHELRTPLFSIIGMLTVLESSTDLSSTHLESLNMIRSSSQQLHRLIDNVLDLAKLESGSIRVDSKPFNLRDVAEEAVETLSYVAHSKGLYLVVHSDISEDPPSLVGDPQRLRQCLLNLLANAVKFTSAGGVKVSWKVEQEGSRCRIEIAVTDTGCGITSAQMGKLFQAFSQIDSSMPGTGLGLTITRELARLQGGECWAESSPGEGSVFNLMVVCDIDRDAKWPSKQAEEHTINRAVVLSEGDAAVDVLRRNLSRMGVAEVVITSSVEEAIASRPDLVVTDLLRRHLSVADLHRMQQSLATPHMYYMMPAAAVGETLLQYDVPHSATLSMPAKTGRLREIVKAVASGGVDREKKKDVAVGQRMSTIDTTFAKTRPLRLLYVDDNKINVVVGLKILSRFGYKGIDAMYDGQQALDALARRSYDAVFMDLQMPVMDGHQFMKAFKDRPESRSTPVCALTANCDEATKKRCIAEGFSYFLSKPLSIKEFTSTLQSIYDSKQGRAST